VYETYENQQGYLFNFYYDEIKDRLDPGAFIPAEWKHIGNWISTKTGVPTTGAAGGKKMFTAKDCGINL
jgi:hypothetical protein